MWGIAWNQGVFLGCLVAVSSTAIVLRGLEYALEQMRAASEALAEAGFQPNQFSTDHPNLQGSLTAGHEVRFKVFNMQGNLITTHYTIVGKNGDISPWDGMLTSGIKAPEGVYFLQYQNQVGGILFNRKQVL